MITPHDEGSGEAIQPIIPEIAQDTYRELFRLADWMFKAKPWEQMYDSHAFVLHNPEKDSAQLACVMGNARSVFALHLYQPEEGTRWRTRIAIEGTNPLSTHEVQFDNRYLSVEFVQEVEMDDHDESLDEAFAPEEWFDASEHDVEAINSVIFRSVLPGCPPWHPTEEEARAMIDGLRMLRRYYGDYFEEYEWASYSPEPDEPIKLPTFQLPKNADRSDPAAWQFSLARFQPPGPKQLPEIPGDDLFLDRLSKFKTKPGTKWELGALFSPKPILSNGRPVYPVIAFIGVSESKRAEGTRTISSQEPRASIFRQSFSKTAEDLGYLPAELAVGSPIAELALADIAKTSGMVILGGGHPMPLFDDIANDMMQSLLFQMEGDEMDDLVRRVREGHFDPKQIRLRDPQAEIEMLEERSR